MAIPELNQNQVDALTSMVDGLGAVSVLVPDLAKDSYERYNLLSNELCDLNQLTILGLLKDVSEQNKDKLATIYDAYKRNFRVFEITDIARRLFNGVERTIQ